MPTKTESILALLRNERTVAEVAALHGVSTADVEAWRALFVDGLAQPRPRLHRRTPRLVAALLACVTVGLAARTAWAGTCASTLPSPLVTLCADEPALATEVNGNFRQLVTWLEAKVGAVTSSSITATALTTTGAVTAGSVSATGNVGAASVSTTGGVTVGGNLSVRGTALGAYVTQSTNTDYTAATDGFVIVGLVGDADGSRCYVHGVVDGTVRVRESLHFYTGSDARVNDAGMTFPVRRGSSWRVSHVNTSSTCTVSVSFVALHP